jgi:hypothetical protein
MDQTAYYLPVGDRGEHRYEPTRATESPWDTKAQHGGPPAALLGHVLSEDSDGRRLARISVDFLGPIPRRDFSIEVSPLKPGRLTLLNEARMIVDGRVVVIARGWHIATGPQPPVATAEHLPPPLPGPAEQRFFHGLDDWGYGESIEWRFTTGGFADTSGAADVWTRVRLPLIEGEQVTGQDRALIVADSANGLSAALPMNEWLSIPPTMTTTLLRPPQDDWVHLACRTHLAADGLGLARGALFDPAGLIGEVAQPLLVRQR